MGWASGFSAGSQLGKTLVDTYQSSKDYEDQQKRKEEMAAIVAAQQIGTGGSQIEGTPEAVQAQLDAGAGVGEARKLASAGTTPTEYSFLGKTSATPLDEAGQASARMQAIAGVMEKNGNPLEAGRYRMQAQQGDLMALQTKQAVRQGKREDKADEHTSVIEGVDRAVGAADAARRTNPDGTVRDANMDDYLHNNLVRATLLTGAGKVKEAGDVIKEHNAQSFAKIQLDTAQRNEDLGRAASALGNGDTSGIKDFYNKHVPDGAHVTNVTEDGKGNITIERTTVDGRPMAPVTKNKNELLAGLNSFKDPMALYHWSQTEFQHNLALKADKRADKSLDIQAGSASVGNDLHRAQIDELKQKTLDKKDLSDIHDSLNTAIDKGDTKAEDAARKKLTSYMARSRGTGMGTLEMNANLYLASGKAKNMSEALDMAHSKVQSTPKDDYIKLTTGAMPRSPDDLERDMSALHGKGWREKMNPTVPATGTYATQADADAAFTAGKIKAGDRVSINGVAGTWK